MTSYCAIRDRAFGLCSIKLRVGAVHVAFSIRSQADEYLRLRNMRPHFQAVDILELDIDEFTGLVVESDDTLQLLVRADSFVAEPYLKRIPVQKLT